MQRVPKEDLHIGSAPAEEDCAQVGTDGYHWRAWHECRALIGQLRRRCGLEPPGTRLYIRQNPHDFGTYLSVNCSYPGGDEKGTAYAFRCEAELPARWDEEAKADLALLDAPPPKPNAKRKARAKKGGVQ
jgi:hypothetical protein